MKKLNRKRIPKILVAWVRESRIRVSHDLALARFRLVLGPKFEFVVSVR